MLDISIEKQRITNAIAGVDREMARKVSPEKAAKLRDVISNAFVGLAAAVTEDDPEAERKADELTVAQQLRLGSVGMLRVLGGVFHDLRAGDNPQNSTTSPSSSSGWTAT